LRVTRAFITGEGQPLDEVGTAGRWHLYWVDVSDDEIGQVQAGTRHGWYAHFWRDDQLLVVYDDARFSMHRHDQVTWQPAVDHGLQQGLRPECLDFPTDASAGTLARGSGGDESARALPGVGRLVALGSVAPELVGCAGAQSLGVELDLPVDNAEGLLQVGDLLLHLRLVHTFSHSTSSSVNTRRPAALRRTGAKNNPSCS
jgi:hypothetical protein